MCTRMVGKARGRLLVLACALQAAAAQCPRTCEKNCDPHSCGAKCCMYWSKPSSHGARLGSSPQTSVETDVRPRLNPADPARPCYGDLNKTMFERVPGGACLLTEEQEQYIGDIACISSPKSGCTQKSRRHFALVLQTSSKESDVARYEALLRLWSTRDRATCPEAEGSSQLPAQAGLVAPGCGPVAHSIPARDRPDLILYVAVADAKRPVSLRVSKALGRARKCFSRFKVLAAQLSALQEVTYPVGPNAMFLQLLKCPPHDQGSWRARQRRALPPAPGRYMSGPFGYRVLHAHGERRSAHSTKLACGATGHCPAAQRGLLAQGFPLPRAEQPEIQSAIDFTTASAPTMH